MSGSNFYALPENVFGDRLRLVGEEAHHVYTVCRYRKGDVIRVVDGQGHAYLTLLEEVGSKVVEGQVIGVKKGQAEPPVRITLAQSIPKGHRFDLIVEKGTEIGVYSIIPMLTDRVLVHPDGFDARLARWRRIAIAAMKQSGRSVLPQITPVMTFEEVLYRIGDYDLSLIAWEDEQRGAIRDWVDQGAVDVLLLIGPEGGFTPQEIEKAREAGVKPISLGPRRLRTETAGVVALSLLLYELGDL